MNLTTAHGMVLEVALERAQEQKRNTPLGALLHVDVLFILLVNQKRSLQIKACQLSAANFATTHLIILTARARMLYIIMLTTSWIFLSRAVGLLKSTRTI